MSDQINFLIRNKHLKFSKIEPSKNPTFCWISASSSVTYKLSNRTSLQRSSLSNINNKNYDFKKKFEYGFPYLCIFDARVPRTYIVSTQRLHWHKPSDVIYLLNTSLVNCFGIDSVYLREQNMWSLFLKGRGVGVKLSTI